mmetsp:Transcript_7445/g.22458  ORF Transcript_7445/g.22458 Transcript_7445/m.22458 type:complete len:205 (-) Transcript_7445:539-1153(-)
MKVTQHSSRGGMSMRHSNAVAKRSERKAAAAYFAAMRDVRFVFTLSLLFFFVLLAVLSLCSAPSFPSPVFAHNTGCVATVKISNRYGLINFAKWSSQNASIAEIVAVKTTKTFSGVSPFLAAALLEHICVANLAFRVIAGAASANAPINFGPVARAICARHIAAEPRTFEVDELIAFNAFASSASLAKQHFSATCFAAFTNAFA